LGQSFKCDIILHSVENDFAAKLPGAQKGIAITNKAPHQI
jgi:hypothetical protein